MKLISQKIIKSQKKQNKIYHIHKIIIQNLQKSKNYQNEHKKTQKKYIKYLITLITVNRIEEQLFLPHIKIFINIIYTTIFITYQLLIYNFPYEILLTNKISYKFINKKKTTFIFCMINNKVSYATD